MDQNMNSMPAEMPKSSKGAANVPATAQPVEVKRFLLRGPHLRLTQATLWAGTDTRNELVQEKCWLLHPSEGELNLQGNAFVVEDVPTESGQIFIMQASLPHERPKPCAVDLRVKAHDVWSGDDGYEFTLFEMEGAEKDSWAVLEYSGGLVGRARVLQNWQQSLRPHTPNHLCPCLLSNTWGDMSGAKRVGEAFVEAEIEAARRLGIEVVQIDAGWQQGVQPQSEPARAKGLWKTDPNFWNPHPERLPHGLAPLARKARDAGMKLGLWFVPDWANDNANWRRDADCVMELYSTLGVEHFKIDSVHTPTETAAANSRRFFKAVLDESRGNVVFDLDITAGVRPGYFGAMDVGPVFVENRYTDWHNYWPHHTLRNLWQLSRWVDPRRLRMEFLNNARHPEKYPDDPLAPSNYSPDTLFASVMFSNPLASFEVSNLLPTYIDGLAPLVRLWKEHRARLFAGAIVPIGAEPDGFAWTGFMSLSESLDEGYVLLFRERNADSRWRFRLPQVRANSCRWDILAGRGHLAAQDDAFVAEIPECFGFLFARFTR